MKFRLKQLRKKKGWTMAELAARSGVSASYISEIESGRYNPTVEVACKISNALECGLDDLIDC